jgi:NAD(P)-dependent dehydrogenase (short-subunit alcohol dehydrogenase family)
MDIHGKNVLITGGAGGIGKATAKSFLRRGAQVTIWDADARALKSALLDLSAYGSIRGYALDITDQAKVSETAQEILKEIGNVDILDNNAGVVSGGPFWSCTPETLRRTVEVNLNAVMWCTRAFLPGMIKKGSGHIVMMASAAGLLGVPGMATYSATKHAVIGLAESIRQELRKAGHLGVKMTIVCPSFVNTGMFEGVTPPLLTPWIEPDFLAEKICSAIEKDRLYIREPFMVKLVPTLKGLVGTSILDRVSDLLGMNRSMDDWKGPMK